jgi:Guanylylate cyclase
MIGDADGGNGGASASGTPSAPLQHYFGPAGPPMSQQQQQILLKHQLLQQQASAHASLAKLPHERQLTTWDCGVACLQMVMASLGHPQERDAILASLDTHSIWTVDLALQLQGWRVRFLMATRTTEVAPAYRAIDFYHKEFEADSQRVSR